MAEGHCPQGTATTADHGVESANRSPNRSTIHRNVPNLREVRGAEGPEGVAKPNAKTLQPETYDYVIIVACLNLQTISEPAKHHPSENTQND